jgi:F420-dependent oxidoreductase-like protein
MRLCVMIEGQEDVTWDDWVALAVTCERLGFEALFRSDHYLTIDAVGPRAALDAWTTIAGMAAHTQTLRLGTLVSPASFRHPSILAKSVTTADHITGGRVELGLGAGWYETEHAAYGFPYLSTRERFDVLEEQLQVVRGHWGDEVFSFSGRHYELSELDARPKPVQRPGPPLLMGGSAGPRAARLAATYADEYNTVYATLEECRERRVRIADACRATGREPIPFSLMTGLITGVDDDAVVDHASRLSAWRGKGGDGEALLAATPKSWLVGTPAQVIQQLRLLEDAGVERVMLQHLLHRDLETLELVASEMLPAVR